MASLPCGQWVNDPDLPVLLDRGLVYQWQSARGQGPHWVPIPMPDPSSAAQAPRLNEMLRVAPQPRGSVAAACTTSTAMPLSPPMPKICQRVRPHLQAQLQGSRSSPSQCKKGQGSQRSSKIWLKRLASGSSSKLRWASSRLHSRSNHCHCSTSQ